MGKTYGKIKYTSMKEKHCVKGEMFFVYLFSLESQREIKACVILYHESLSLQYLLKQSLAKFG